MIHGRSCGKANGQNAHLSGGVLTTRWSGPDHRPRRSLIRKALGHRAGAHSGSISEERGRGEPGGCSSSRLGGLERSDGVPCSRASARFLQEHRHDLCRDGSQSELEPGIALNAARLEARRGRESTAEQPSEEMRQEFLQSPLFTRGRLAGKSIYDLLASSNRT